MTTTTATGPDVSDVHVDLHGQTAIVSGAATGIGRAIALPRGTWEKLGKRLGLK